jgi:flagellar biosynthetic protein FlhB
VADDRQEERTEEPTPKRLRDARRRGEVAQSRALSGAAAFALQTGALILGAGFAWQALSRLLVDVLQVARGSVELEPATSQCLAAGMATAARLVLPILVAGVVGAAAIGALQVRGILTLTPLEPSFDRLNPAKGLGRLFSLAALGQLGRALAAAVVVFVVTALLVRDRLATVLGAGMSPTATLAAGSGLLQAFFVRAVVVLGAFGALDFLWLCAAGVASCV